jgi:hypothetical protein
LGVTAPGKLTPVWGQVDHHHRKGENQRTVKFGIYTTDSIRVNVTGALAGNAWTTEIGAWTP